VLGVVGVLAIALVVNETGTHAAYSRIVASGCLTSFHVPCGELESAFGARGYVLNALVVAMHVVPLLIGTFIGAPLLARELESGTFRFAWTQGTGRTRWVVTKLVLLATVVGALTCALGLVFGWYVHPFDAVGYSSRWLPGRFDVTGLTLAAWTLFALALGAFLGLLIRRTVAAMAATVALAGALLVAAYWRLDEQLLGLGPRVARASPDGWAVGPLHTYVTSQLPSNPGPPGSWLISSWYTGPGGGRLSADAANLLLGRLAVMFKPAATVNDATAWLTAHHYVYWVSFQPPGRYWLFQGIEGAVLLGLALVLALATVALVRRRG
jgi:hypothetical protein